MAQTAAFDARPEHHARTGINAIFTSGFPFATRMFHGFD
jgi:hypothetical protein